MLQCIAPKLQPWDVGGQSGARTYSMPWRRLYRFLLGKTIDSDDTIVSTSPKLAIPAAPAGRASRRAAFSAMRGAAPAANREPPSSRAMRGTTPIGKREPRQPATRPMNHKHRAPRAAQTSTPNVNRRHRAPRAAQPQAKTVNRFAPAADTTAWAPSASIARPARRRVPRHT